MKKIIAAIMLLPSLAFGAANDLFINQRNGDDTGTLSRTVTVPAAGADGILGFNGSTVRPQFFALGSGISIVGGVLTVSSPAATWASITGKPAFANVSTTGAYADLTGKPTIPAPQVQSDWLATVAPAAILNKPVLSAVAISGAYTDLSGRPAIPAAQVNADWSASSGVTTILNKPTTLAGYGITNAYPLSGNPSGFLTGITAAQVSSALGFTPYNSANPSGYVDQAGARSAIALTTNGTTGAATYNAATGMLNIPAYAGSSGTVTSVTAGSGLSGGTITTSGIISLPATGTAGSYNASVTTDAQGRVTAGTSLVINDSPGRALVTSTAGGGFQVSATRAAQVCYEGGIQTTSTIGGPAAATVFLETADTNSATATDWTVKAQQTYTNTITLAVVLNQVQSNNWAFCRYIPAGKYVRIRVGAVTGTASATINSSQQEVLH